MRVARLSAWGAAAALVVLSARTLSYALAPPTILGGGLQAAAGGPRLVTVALVCAALAAAVSAAIVGLAALAVRERLALTPEHVVAPPVLRPARMVARFTVVFAATSVIFALLESYLHWRAGLGWHGLHCLVGPVHRDALPLLGSLSAVAVAIVTAVEHANSWIRRTIARLRARRVLSRAPLPAPIPTDRVEPRWLDRSRAPRGPPRFVVLELSN
jgi:hypothetical protein